METNGQILDWAAWTRNPASNYSTLTSTTEVTLSTLLISSEYHRNFHARHFGIMLNYDKQSRRLFGDVYWGMGRAARHTRPTVPCDQGISISLYNVNIDNDH